MIARAQPITDRFYMAFVFGAQRLPPLFAKGRPILFPAHGNTETWVPGDIIRLEASGLSPVQLTLLRNGNPVLTYTDTTENLVGGSPGIGIYSPPGDHLAIDDWEGGNLGMQGIVVPQGRRPECAGEFCGDAIRCEPGKLLDRGNRQCPCEKV